MTTLMRRTLLTTATAAGLAAVAVPAEAAPSASGKALIGKARKDQLHVMTFNIRMDNSTNTQPGDADHWPERRPLLVELLEREQPTLLGVQEAKYAQLGALEEALPKHRMIGYGRQGGSRDEYSAIFYDATRLEVLAWDQFWLSDTPDVIGSATWGNTVTRIVTWAHLRDLRSGTELVHVNTHFDHRSEEARIRSGEAIAALLEDEELAGLPLILTGDFNSPAPNSGAYTTLVTDGPLLDTWDSAEKRLTPAWGTFPGYEDPVEGNDRIDWICTSEGVRALRTAINVWRDADGRYPSDHAPVQTLIALP
ncbi:endonuclease/exonuclease/phosphatase family protein [Brachybacterium squillarum]|uniref:endonuclease/exonuclease/phosphatase family protein n=1 Tax=Brachybacterium squillarum TaxID=661979 RepID=UPI002223C401|nr:endonuclease/exonuclease/phosphatase family protein [Brachybacterium squillarum]MCW1804767.1 endonuclease/exonuclease/phosphatase family protein [Brachybacterium squillarum]